MSSLSDPIVLVTPVWNDSTRLNLFGDQLARELAAAQLSVKWIIADDGSDVSEHTPLTRMADSYSVDFPHVSVHFADWHVGKGGVIKQAWALEPTASWYAFVDADGSVSAADTVRLLRQALDSSLTTLAVRERTPTTQIEEGWYRAIAHRVFLKIARGLLCLDAKDPQCGAKVIRGDEYREVVNDLEEPGFAFDCELLAMLDLRGFGWQEVPVTWIEKKGGKVRPFRDAWGMLAALIRIRRRRKKIKARSASQSVEAARHSVTR